MKSDETKSSRNDASRRRPDSLRFLANRVERTYWARREMARRLQNRGMYWNAALVSLTLCTTLASVSLLRNGELYGDQGDVAMVVLGIFSLVASLMVGTANYASRSRLAFENYRHIQRLSTELEALVARTRISERKLHRFYEEFDRRYQDILDSSDNHEPADFTKTIQMRWRRPASDSDIENRANDVDYLTLWQMALRRTQQLGTFAMTLLPVGLIGVAIVLTLPNIVWLVSGE